LVINIQSIHDARSEKHQVITVGSLFWVSDIPNSLQLPVSQSVKFLRRRDCAFDTHN